LGAGTAAQGRSAHRLHRTAAGDLRFGSQLQIDQSDRIGFHEVLERLRGTQLDLLIHSPGGYPEATEGIVDEIRSQFTEVRAIVPAYAKSAATMLAFACNEILADEQAELGPIDPQMMTANGPSPAQSVKEQFEKASVEVQKDPQKIAVWFPILQQMGPALLVQSDDAIKLSLDLVTGWLTRFMFIGDAQAAQKADAIAQFFGNRANFQTHGRPITIRHITERNLPLRISNIRENAELYRLVWEVYCMLDIAFSNTTTYKLFYNSLGDAMTRTAAQGLGMLQLLAQPQPVQPGSPPAAPPAPQPPVGP
jgi:hypothetical protein